LAVSDAIKYSCNVFFFTLMMRMDFDKWSKWGPEFGFGVETPTDLPEVVSGLLPDSAYFDRTYPRGWTRGYLVSLGIGQGNMVITPLQLARYAAALANGGTLVTPHIVRSAVDPQTGEHMELQLAPPHHIPIAPQHFATVREGMRGMAMENNSTVQWGDVVIAGKTGTAQNPHGKDHSWFMAFAPYDHPQVALAVLVENAGFGASVAAPMSALLLEQYLDGTIDKHPEYVRNMAFNSSSEGMEHGEGMKWRHYYDRDEGGKGPIAAGMAK
jgi:penicillin-binding protein 2